MNKERKVRLRAQLLSLRSRAMARMQNAKSTIAEASREHRVVGDLVDQMQGSIDVDVLTRTNEQAAAELKQIERALASLDSERYGECLACGWEIPVKRLEARPFAAKCVTCQAAEEEGAAA